MATKTELPTRDFNIFYLHSGGGGTPTNVGMFLPPRRAHRMRRRDRLLIFIRPADPASLSAAEQEKLLARLGKHYFETAGSVTSALRDLAHALNIYLLKRNRQAPSPQARAVVSLAMAVWRGNMLYLALSGQMHALVVGKERRHFYNPSASGRGLGLGKSAPLYFASAEWENGNALAFAPSLPASVEVAQGIKPLAEALLGAQGELHDAVLATTRAGEGAVQILPMHKAAEGKPAPRPQPSVPRAEAPKPASRPIPQPQKPPPPQEPPKATKKPSAPKKPIPKPKVSLPTESVRAVGRAVWGVGEAIGAAFGKISAEMLPGEDLFALPRSLMALIAVAVPLVIVTMAVVVYLRRGRAEQYQAYFARAQAEAAHALALKEPVARHNALQTALADLDAAEAYRQTAQSRALRERLEGALDQLDGIRRLNFTSALSRRAPPGTVITRLVLQGGDMYALDAATGGVLHFQQNGSLYRPDEDFQCAPGAYGALQVSKFVDIAPLPLSENGYRIVGMDTHGNLVLCAPGKAAQAIRLAPPTPMFWKTPKAIAYVGGDLYVLDPGIRTIEIVGHGPAFDGTPYSYFTGDIPKKIEEAIDFAVLRGDLYLLFNTGEVSLCRRSPALEKSECSPLIFHDERPGRSDGPVIPDARFTQIAVQPPPDPSLLLLDPQAQAVYRFSLQLRFVAQFRPNKPLARRQPATAFAVDPDTHILFLAIGSEIYQAPME